MKLTEILSANRVVAGTPVTSKKRALEEMSKLLAKGSGTVTEGEIFTALTSREKLGSTGLGHGGMGHHQGDQLGPGHHRVHLVQELTLARALG